MTPLRSGPLGVCVAVFVLVATVAALFYCVFPWSITVPQARAQRERDLFPSTLVILSDSLEVQGEIDTVNGLRLQAWKKRDADLFARTYALDGELFLPGGKVIHGRDAIRERMKDTFHDFRVQDGSITTTGLWLVGNYAYESGRRVFKLGKAKGRAGAGGGNDTVYHLQVWKQEAGRWRIWRDVELAKG